VRYANKRSETQKRILDMMCKYVRRLLSSLRCQALLSIYGREVSVLCPIASVKCSESCRAVTQHFWLLRGESVTLQILIPAAPPKQALLLIAQQKRAY